jgi:hypothetical protein
VDVGHQAEFITKERKPECDKNERQNECFAEKILLRAGREASAAEDQQITEYVLGQKMKSQELQRVFLVAEGEPETK